MAPRRPPINRPPTNPRRPKSTKAETIPRLKDSSVRTMDEVKAFFQRGIVTGSGKGHRSGSSKPKQNRIYTVAELITKFGKPDERKRFASSERWIYVCSDGSVSVTFENKGYGGGSGADAESKLRLQISWIDVK